MAIWMQLWKICLVGSLAAFAVLAVVVSIGGALDIRKMIRRLSGDEEV